MLKTIGSVLVAVAGGVGVGLEAAMKAVAIVGAWWGYHAAALAAIPVMKLEDLGAERRLVFFLNYSARVPDTILGQHVCINFHCTPLPDGRGGHPIENLIRLGHAATVITAHTMTAEMDAGPIWGVRGPISLDGTKAQIQARFIDPVSGLIRGCREALFLPMMPQEGEVVTFQRLSADECKSLWQARG